MQVEGWKVAATLLRTIYRGHGDDARLFENAAQSITELASERDGLAYTVRKDQEDIARKDSLMAESVRTINAKDEEIRQLKQDNAINLTAWQNACVISNRLELQVRELKRKMRARQKPKG